MTQTTGAENSTQQSNPFLFRSPQSEVVSQTARVSESNISKDAPVNVEPTVTEYLEVTKVPFTAKFFGLDSNFEELSGTDKKSIEKIESYLISKVKSGEYPDDLKSAKAMINNIMEKIKLTDEHDSFFKLDKIAEYMKVIKDPLNLKRDMDKEKRSLKINLTKTNKEQEYLSRKLDLKIKREQNLKQQIAIEQSKTVTLKKAFAKLLEAI